MAYQQISVITILISKFIVYGGTNVALNPANSYILPASIIGGPVTPWLPKVGISL